MDVVETGVAVFVGAGIAVLVGAMVGTLVGVMVAVDAIVIAAVRPTGSTITYPLEKSRLQAVPLW